MERSLAGLLILAVLAGAAGCKSTGPAGGAQSQGLAVSATYRTADVPVPTRFTLDESVSFQVESPLIVHHVYRAFRVPRRHVVRFYRDQMPVARWQPIGRVDAGGVRLLVFERDGQKCLIHIKRSFRFWTRLKIEVVGPAAGP